MRFTTIALLIATASATGRRPITEEEACTLQHKVSPNIKYQVRAILFRISPSPHFLTKQS